MGAPARQPLPGAPGSAPENTLPGWALNRREMAREHLFLPSLCFSSPTNHRLCFSVGSPRSPLHPPPLPKRCVWASCVLQAFAAVGRKLASNAASSRALAQHGAGPQGAERRVLTDSRGIGREPGLGGPPGTGFLPPWSLGGTSQSDARR